jgi:hypothetical protein
MPRYPEHGDDDFSLMVDPFTGRVALMCPAPIIAFDSIGEFNDWVNGLLDAVPQITRSLHANDSISETPINKDYASAVIETWEEQILESLAAAQKTTGQKKSVKKQKSSMNEDPNF